MAAPYVESAAPKDLHVKGAEISGSEATDNVRGAALAEARVKLAGGAVVDGSESWMSRVKNTGVFVGAAFTAGCGSYLVALQPTIAVSAFAIGASLFVALVGAAKYGLRASTSAVVNTVLTVLPPCFIARAVMVYRAPDLRIVLTALAETLAIIGYIMSVCLHRYFSHAAFRTTRPFQCFLAILGSCAYQGSPIWWASKHRRHHKYCDLPEDPHSWKQTSHWYAWWGWTLNPAEQLPDEEYVTAMLKMPELVFVCRIWILWPTLVNLLVYKYFGYYNMVCYCLTPMFMSRVVTLLFNVEFHPPEKEAKINPFNGKEEDCVSIDLASFFADLVGESCHEDHHAHPRRACRPSAGFPWFDVPYYTFILPMLKLGLIWGAAGAEKVHKY